MAKSINCADVGVDCEWSATAETEEELMKKIQQHAKEHGFDDIPSDMVDKVKGAIKDQ